jgi:hypothetical protein
MFKKPNIDIEDLEFYINEYVLNGGEPFTLIKKVKVDKILKEEIATRWNPLTRSNQYLGWNLKVKLTFYVTEGAIGRFFYDEIEMFDRNFKGDFIKKYLNYPINEFTYDGYVKELNNEENLTESIRKILKEEITRDEILKNAEELLNLLPIDDHIERIEIKNFGVYRRDKNSCDIYVFVDEQLSTHYENGVTWKIIDTIRNYYPQFNEHFDVHQYVFEADNFLYA